MPRLMNHYIGLLSRCLVLGFLLVLLVPMLLGACRATPTPEPSPTIPPYTPPAVSNVSPVIIQRTPERGEELPVNGTIELVFDRAMDRLTVERAFQISPQVEGRLEWADERTVRFKPARDLKRATDYYVTLGPTAKAADGNHLDGAYRFRFRTVGYLEVAQVIPAPGAQDVEAPSTITVIFNRPVVPLRAISDPAYGELPQPLILDPPVEGEGTWLNTSIYVFTPSSLQGGTTYKARIKAGLQDTTGGVLAEDYEWSFSTQPPKVVWVSPGEDASLVGVDTSVQVTFNMPVDCASAGQAFSLHTGLMEVSGVFACSDATLIFTPTVKLDFDTTFQARVKKGVHGAGGGEGMREDYEWHFTTVPLPRVLGTRPYDGQKDAQPYTDFQILFNAPIDPATVMPNLEMKPPISPSQVYTYFTWDNVFVLGFGAQPSTDYEVHIGPNIADPYGNTTGQEMTVRFRTAPLDPGVWLLMAGQTGTLGADQPAQIVAACVNVTQLDLSLYRIGIDEFHKVSQSWWEYRPSVPPLREWSLPVEAPLNRRQYIPVKLAEDGGPLTPGIYLFEIHAPGVHYDEWSHRKILIVSEYNITLKKGPGEMWAWVTSLATGQPTGGLSLSVRDGNGTVIASATTDGNGVAHFALPTEVQGDLIVAAEEPFVLGSSGWDWSRGISPWDFGLEEDPWRWPHRVYIYTDRPIYRPGQTVYFRGIVRAEDDVHYNLPALEKVTVVIWDAAGEQIFNESLPLDRAGTFHGQVTLAGSASLGQYAINVVDIPFEATFQVAAYRAPEFEVLVKPAQSELVAGTATRADVAVRYFSGGPVAEARVEWNVLSTPYRFAPEQFGRYDFTDEEEPWICRWCWWWEPPAPHSIFSASGTTDKEGQATIELPSRVMTGGQQLTIEASVYGRDGQVISGRSNVVVHKGEFYIGLAPQQYVGRAGREMKVDVVTVDWAGKRVPFRDLNLEIYRREWANTFVEEEPGGGHWEWTAQDTLVYTGTLTTDAQAEGVVTFTPPQGGSYRVAVSARDTRHTMRSSTWVWISSDEDVSWQRENNDRIMLISDRSTYLPGETAEILIPSPFSGEQWAWVAVERGKVLHQEVLRLTNNSTVYRLPITTDHVPNIYVSVVIVQGPRAAGASEPVPAHRVGYTVLTVKPLPQTLNITVTPGATQAAPGDTVAFNVRVTDATGRPVEAFLSLDLVDKAVLSLKPRTPNAIVEAFYGRRGLGISTSSGLVPSLNRLLLEQLRELEAVLAQRGSGLGGGGEAPEAMMPAATPVAAYEAGLKAESPMPPPGIELREEFADTAFWDAAIVTDRTGQTTLQLRLPDNLTTWVIRAVGVTVATEVGEGTAELPVTKPLLVRPVVPRFFVVGDRAQLAALVSNNTDQALDVTVTLHSTGLTLDTTHTSSYESKVKIPAHSEEKVTWHVIVEDVNAVNVIVSAVSGAYSDAARPRLTTGPEGTLLVHRYTAPEIVGTGGQLVGEEVRTEVVALPPKYDDRRGELVVRLDPSLAAGMVDGLNYLEHFPYECTEQTVSRFLPNVLTYRALQRLGIKNPELEEKLPGLVQEGLEKLYLQQRSDGGWGWWSDGESNPHLTAYVVFALVKARDAGFEVRGEVIQQALDYLADRLVGSRDLRSYREANLQAFILYVMTEAGRADRVAGFAGDLFERREKLSHYGRAFLALALHIADQNDPRVSTLLSDLQNAAILSATGAHWEEADYDWWAMNTDTRSTAIILDALARLEPQNELIPNVVRWLMAARRDGIWETTQETAWAIIAFTDWMAVTGELGGEYDYAVLLNDSSLASGAVTPDRVNEPIRLRVDVADLLADVGNRLTIGRGAGRGRLYYTAHLKVYLPVEEIEPLNRGIILSRRYTAPDCSEGVKCPEVNEARAGETVQVRLTIIAPHDLYYVIVEDPLPAGAEPIDTALETTSLLEQQPSLYRQTEDKQQYEFYHWWWRWYSRSEMRDDRVVLFADYLPAGTYEYVYTFRATYPGEYRVVPTSAYEFYFPEVFGRADGRLFTIK